MNAFKKIFISGKEDAGKCAREAAIDCNLKCTSRKKNEKKILRGNRQDQVFCEKAN